MTAILVLTVTLVIGGNRTITTIDLAQPSYADCQKHGEMLVEASTPRESYRFRCELRT